MLVLQELAERLSAQIDSANTEIDETRAILKDAIDRLMPAFCAAQGIDGPAALREKAFSALQFQDISDQQLAHAQTRLAALQKEIDALTAALTPAPRHEISQWTEHVLSLVEAANDNLAELDLSLNKPVANAHLGTGDMELF
jgi:DNA repair exonuclease SbcCD ATPase subunit